MISHKFSTICKFAVLAVGLAPPLASQSLAPRVLVVYNSTSPDSINVANHYIAARGIPPQNLCAIAPPSTTYLILDDYINTVKAPIQQCLNTIGRSNILYIVFSYLTPYNVYVDGINYALDQYVADIWDLYTAQPLVIVPPRPHGYYANSQAQGNVYLRFQSFAAYRDGGGGSRLAGSPGGGLLIYSVWRLDGPSAAIASALVDNAIAAENAGGPSGQACIDETYGPTGSYDAFSTQGNWDLFRAGQFLVRAGLNVTTDTNSSEFGTFPSALTCKDQSGNTALYSGWYSLNHYNGPDVFNWSPGSIGFHLDSFSAGDPRGGTNWSANALLNNISVTSGSVNEPFLEGLPRPGGVYRNLLEGANVGDAFLRNTRWLKWMVINIGDPLYTPYAGGRAPFNPAPPENSLALNPRELTGGEPVSNLPTATINLSAPAPPGGTTFSIFTDVGGVATVPSSVTVPEGNSSASFQITTVTVTDSTALFITAMSDNLTLQNTLIVDPLLSGLVLNPSTTSAGQSVTGTVLLGDRAPAKGATIALSSSNPSAAPPSSVTVPPGQISATFTVTTTPVTAQTQLFISASYAGAVTSGSLTLLPAIQSAGFGPAAVPAGQATVYGLTLSTPAPPGGAVVILNNSNPAVLTIQATLTVPAGQTYANCFGYTNPAALPGSTAQVTATYGGDMKPATITVQ